MDSKINDNLINLTKLDPKMKQAIMDNASKRAQILLASGRELASSMFQTMITGAKSQQETGEKLFILRMAAVHILAMDAFNYEKGTGGKGNMFVDQLTIDIRNELKWLQIEDMAGRLTSTNVSDKPTADLAEVSKEETKGE